MHAVAFGSMGKMPIFDLANPYIAIYRISKPEIQFKKQSDYAKAPLDKNVKVWHTKMMDFNLTPRK
jgi:hypothetical protein